MKNVKRLFDIPYAQLEKYPLEDALVSKVNGTWHKVSTEEYINKANEISRTLIQKGVKKGDKIALISNNRFEWHIMDIGIQQIGAINVPIYPTISESDYAYIFNDAEVKMCVVSDEELYRKVMNIKSQVPTLGDVYTFNEVKGAEHWTVLLKQNEEVELAAVRAISDTIVEEDIATLIYTSGTTGNPKGVVLTHKNLVSNVFDALPRLPIGPKVKALSFLPICHVYERMLLYLFQYHGVRIYFAESIETIGDNIKEIKPEVFSAVPRLLEKVYDKIIAKGADLSGIKKALFFWSVSVAEQWEPYHKNGWWYDVKLSIARKLVFSKWQEGLGGNVKAVVSGSAALQSRLARVFWGAGIPVLEGYGLTETSPVISVNCEAGGGLRIGSVGKPLDHVEVKIAEDGEILVKGPNVMREYYKKPEKTAEVFNEDGYFMTGDIGHIDSDGFLVITDRKKEMFKTSGGKYVAPQVLENEFKTSRFIEQIMVVGENRKHPSAIVVPAFEVLKEWCKRKEIPYTTDAEMITNERIIKRIEKDVNYINRKFGKWEQVKKIALVDHSWSTESGELTPTLKLKRKVINVKYEKEINGFYE